MTTITTTHNPRTPLVVALAAGAALVAGGAIGVAWEQNHSSPVATHSHATTAHSFGGATTSDEFARTSDSPGGATTSDELSGTTSGSLPATGSPGGATTSQESTQ
jgi:hypothetical protein